MPKLDHIHIYQRWKKRFGELHYRCLHPDCTYTAPKSMIEGKRSMCTNCKEKDFILTKYDLRLKNPVCPACSNTQEAKDKRKYQDLVGSLLGGRENAS